MNITKNNKKFLKNYKVPNFLIDDVYLNFVLLPTKTLVKSKIKFRVNPKAENTNFYLHGENLELITAKIDGDVVYPKFITDGITLDVPNTPFVWEAEVEINPKANTLLEGLYISGGIYTTQCEAEGFRRITYYPDRPDILATFTVRIESDKPILLSNGNLINSGPGFAEWHDPWPKPSYLFALVAGDLVKYSDHFLSQSGKLIDLNIWVRKGDELKCWFAMESLKKAMEWDERTYGLEYDLNLFNIVAIDDFNMGAMENKGLNIFNSAAVLATPETATDMNYERIESIIAHEYFHNWTGNRVTCRDWFQLCLKEGLTVFRDQQFTSDTRSEAIKRISDVKDLRSRQFREDSGPLAHPVRPEEFVEINNFYTATIYEKGAEIISMLKLLVGDRDYYKAVKLYFSRHDGEACTIEDWLMCFEETTGRNLAQFKLWYRSAGTPEIHVKETYINNILTITLIQQNSKTSTPYKDPLLIPVSLGLINNNGKEIISTTILEFNKTTQEFQFDNLNSKPIISLLRGFSAPVILKHSRPLEEYAFLLKNDTDAFNKWEASRLLCLKILTSAGQSKADASNLYLSAIGKIANNSTIEPGLKALLLTIPTQDEVTKELARLGKKIDPDEIFKSIKDFEIALADYLDCNLMKLYSENFVSGSYNSNAVDDGKRALRSVILKLISCRDSGEAAEIQFEQSNTMQEQLSALNCLAEFGKPHIQLQKFFMQWQNERLVIDKWFAIQIVRSHPGDTIGKIDTLTKHPLFDMLNPNRFRAVFGSLIANSVAFHQASGVGYAKLADWIIKLDPQNPQTAARICTAFDDWSIYDDARQEKIQYELKRILNQKNLSKDTTDIIVRILDC